MTFSRLQVRHLCLLVLLQLVIGPLVLTQVSLFCTLTVREIPQQGVAKAVVKAWNNERFQTLLTASDNLRLEDSSATSNGTSTKVKSPVLKLSLALWEPQAALPALDAETVHWPRYSGAWTPSDPPVPPGIPPRAA